MINKTLFNFVISIASVAMTGAIVFSCNSDEVIEQEIGAEPQIVFDNDSGEYNVIQGHTLCISPVYKHVDGAKYSWCIDDVPVADTRDFTYTWNEVGEFYVSISVVTPSGKAFEEIKVIVTAPALPVISLPLSDNEVTLLVNNKFVLLPEIKNADTEDFRITWAIDNRIVCESLKFEFSTESVGEYIITVTASNIYGSDTKELIVHVVEQMPISVKFPTPSYFNKSTTRYTFPNRQVYLVPIISGAEVSELSWLVNGAEVADKSRAFKFTSNVAGEYDVTVIVNNKYSASVKVVCVDSTEGERKRANTAGSNKRVNKVFEYCPAPGQFIGETNTGGMTGNETTLEQANQWAMGRLEKENFVSLGAFGGYIIVGFDHSIENNNSGYDFSIMANAFFNAQSGTGGSNEPGIVYVMQDVNGNGLPDDEWYELRGSNTGVAGTISDYAITYYKPAADRMNVQWTDNYGNTGTVDYLASFHRQPSYYPAWIEADSYTLYGTRLEARNSQDSSTGMWNNYAFEWGYVDNMGSDVISSGGSGGEGQQNGFKILNAMYFDQTPVKLEYIDFIKVQTGVCAKSGHLGEVSTEVFGLIDL